MTKDEFLSTLSDEQKEFVERLIDEAWVKGYDEGKLESSAVYKYYAY